MSVNLSSTLLFRTAILSILAFSLWACGSAPPKQAKNKQVTAPVTTIDIVKEQTTLDIIREDFLQTGNVEARNFALVNLADSHYLNNNCSKANIILAHINDSIVNDQTQAIADLIKSECLLLASNIATDDKVSLLNTWLTHASTGLNTAMQQRYWVAKSSFFVLQQQYANALTTLMQANSSAEYLLDPVYGNNIWQWFSLSTPNERSSLTSRFPVLRDHAALLQIIEDSSLNDKLRQKNLQQWLTQYADAPIALNVPSQISQYLLLNSQQQQRTAVLLPLSGRLTSQGNAIKQGVLTAYLDRLELQSNQQVPSLTFIDTGSLSQLSSDVNAGTLSEFDMIIGPLLKSHVEQLASFDLNKAKKVLLNNIDETQAFDNNLYTYYALSPEQEAVQLANVIYSRNVTNPVLINDSSAMGKRLSEAFSEQWSRLHPAGANTSKPNNLTEIAYTNNKSMRIGITSALDVLQSQRRIQQLSNLSSERVYSVTRNRRDVDAFIVFAKPEDLELINPIIESSISLFTEQQVPVFASSYSYNHKQNKNTQRDLKNLVFIDMPWLLPEGRQSALSAQINTLFNQPPSAFLRLFAFGYDALALSENMAQLSTFKHMHIKGLSGTLQISDDKTLLRELSSISITGN
ncbi:MAG: penicillin-binding protein activator [Glaciecola sp.]